MEKKEKRKKTRERFIALLRENIKRRVQLQKLEKEIQELEQTVKISKKKIENEHETK